MSIARIAISAVIRGTLGIQDDNLSLGTKGNIVKGGIRPRNGHTHRKVFFNERGVSNVPAMIFFPDALSSYTLSAKSKA